VSGAAIAAIAAILFPLDLEFPICAV